MSGVTATGDAPVAPASAARTWIDTLGVGLVVLIVGLSILDTLPVGAYFDDGMYVILAKSIATGHGYRWLQLPGTPPATHFPPGYPAVLALLWKLYPHFPSNVVLFKAASVVFLAIAAAGVAVLARRRLGLPRWGAAAVSLASMLGLPTLILGAQVMSEPLFLALLFPTLLFAEKVVDRESRLGEVIALGAAVGLVTLVRTHGVAIAGAVLLVLLVRRRVRDAFVFGCSTLVMLLPWQIWSRLNAHALPGAVGGNYEPYSTWLMEGYRAAGPLLIPRTIAGVGSEIGGIVALLAAPSMPRNVKIAAIVVVLGLCLAGLSRLRRTAPVTALFFVLYLAIVLLWPFTPARFVWGIWPLVFLLPVLGALEIAGWRPRIQLPRVTSLARVARVVALGCAWLVAAGYARYTARAYEGHWWSSIPRRNSAAARPLVQWVRANTAPDAIIASNYEPMVYLYGHRRSVPVTRFSVRDYFRPPTLAESADAVRGILGVYRVDKVAVISLASVRAALQSMATEPSPELVPVDTLGSDMIFSPVSHR